MRLPSRTRLMVLAVGFGTALVSGCAGGSWFGNKDLPPEPKPGPRETPDIVLGDTVGSYAMVGSGQPMRLRGFGIVIGLGETGGSDCPSTIREYLLDYLAREFAPRDVAAQRPNYSAKELLDSLDTAVVAVQGMVPAGAPAGAGFDLYVQALGTQTSSLEGGVLVLCELKHFNVSAAGKGLVTGQPLARARGLIYTSSTPGADSEQRRQELRSGYVLGGGRTLEERTTRLLLNEPSYWTARKIERRINERFGQDPPAATAMSKGYITLSTPDKYEKSPQRFLELVTHLYLENQPRQIEQKNQLLSRELDGSPELLDHISLVWEGLGRSTFPHLQPLYTHADPHVAFYSARAGLRLKDINALAPMVRMANEPENPCRLQAVRELGDSEYPQAVRPLSALLDSESDSVRIAAYEGMLNYRHPSVKTIRFISSVDPTQYNLMLDVVESKGAPLVYVSRTMEPRIAVFGSMMPISLPLFYNHPDDYVTLNALEEGDEISVLWRSKTGRLSAEPLKTPARVVDLIEILADAPRENDEGELYGIGMNYSRIVEVLNALCESKAIPATLVVQATTLGELTEPLQLPERPEADETPLMLEERSEAVELTDLEEESDEGWDYDDRSD